MADTTPRPWHGKVNPMEAIHDWMAGEIAALKAEIAKLRSTPTPTPSPAPAPVVMSPPPPPPVVPATPPVVHPTIEGVNASGE